MYPRILGAACRSLVPVFYHERQGRFLSSDIFTKILACIRENMTCFPLCWHEQSFVPSRVAMCSLISFLPLGLGSAVVVALHLRQGVELYFQRLRACFFCVLSNILENFAFPNACCERRSPFHALTTVVYQMRAFGLYASPTFVRMCYMRKLTCYCNSFVSALFSSA